MRYCFYTIFFINFLFAPTLVLADIAVFVHGYNSDGHTWRKNGVLQPLVSSGWNDVSYSQYGLSNSGNHLVTVNLPPRSPVEVQASYLNQFLTEINQQFPQQNLHLVAHSSGGIVARLTLINNFLAYLDSELNKESKNSIPLPIVQLITIATPHLGSPIAEMAHSASDTPIGFFAPLFGLDEINQAEILYKQMSRPHKNGFLHWLNQQPHPPISYSSIVRRDGSLISGDIYVPPHSQNMAFVPPIGQQSYLLLTPGDHSLQHSDGIFLINLLQ